MNAPTGFTDRGGSESMMREKLSRKFLDTFCNFGFQVFQPSPVQPLEDVFRCLPSGFRKKVIPFAGPGEGQRCLIPDVTLAAISYVTSHHAPEERPLRLCYVSSVYRIPDPPEDRVESLHAGAEMIGWEGEAADVEMMALMMRFLDYAGGPETTIVFGDVNLTEFVLGLAPPSAAASLRLALLTGSITEYNAILDSHPLPESARQSLRNLPFLKGGPEVLDRSADLLPENAPLADLKKLVASVVSFGFTSRIKIDLGLVRKLDYYSGPVFEVYDGCSGGPVGGGGRYDGLLASSGVLGQAFGFSLELDAFAENRGSACRGARDPVMLWAGDSPVMDVFNTADRITAAGFSVEISWNPGPKASFSLSRRRGCICWVDLPRQTVKTGCQDGTVTLDQWLTESPTC